MIVCPYCKGEKFNRHDPPPGMRAIRWEELVGPLRTCLLCKGSGKIAQEIFNRSAIGDLTGVVFCSTLDGKKWASCMEPGCRCWLDVTPFFGTQERGIRVGDFVAKCASGLPNHVMRFSIEV